MSSLPVKTGVGGGQLLRPVRLRDFLLANARSKEKPCFLSAIYPSSQKEKYLTLSAFWHDLPMLAVIALVFIKRDLQMKFYLAFDPR